MNHKQKIAYVIKKSISAVKGRIPDVSNESFLLISFDNEFTVALSNEQIEMLERILKQTKDKTN